MRKLVTFLAAFLVGTTATYVSADNGQLTIQAGYRQDNVDWHLKVPSSSPDYENAVSFKNVNIFEIILNGRTNLGCNFFGRASAGWGWIFDGDYKSTYKSFTEFSREERYENYSSSSSSSSSSSGGFNNDIVYQRSAENVIDDRFVLDFDVAIGYPFYFCDCTASIAPVVGYGFDEQNFRVEGEEANKFSSVEGISEAVPFSVQDCCWDKFIYRWYGPFVGLDFDYQASQCLSMYAQLAYHWVQFKGKRNSHTGIDIFDSYNRSSTDGHGWSLKGGLYYALCDCWNFGLSAGFKDFRVSDKHNYVTSDLFSHEEDSSSSSEVGKFHSNNKWRTWFVSLDVGYVF